MARKPDPNHPLHQAAETELVEINKMAAPDGTAPDPSPAPDHAPAVRTDPAPVSHAPDPEDLRPNPPEADARYVKVQQQVSTLLGRLEAERDEKERLQRGNEDLSSNVQFLTDRANETKRLLDEALARRRELETQLEVTTIAKDFTSEVLDADQFAEIVRGITPQLRRRDEAIDSLRADQIALRKEIADANAQGDARVAKVRKDLTDKLLLRDEPEFDKLVAREDFQDFLAETVPGTRRTRQQEVLAAYQDGDTRFIAQVVGDFKKRGKPEPVDSGLRQPPRSPGQQQPRAPSKAEPITEDMLQEAHQQVLNGDLDPDEYRKLSKAHKAQQGLKVAAN